MKTIKPVDGIARGVLFSGLLAIIPAVSLATDDGLGLTDARPGQGDYEPRPLFNAHAPDSELGLSDPLPGQGDYQIRPLIPGSAPADAQASLE